MNPPINLQTNMAFTAYLGTERYREYTWLMMMAKSFRLADHHREVLSTQGSWTARTANLERYARFDTIA